MQPTWSLRFVRTLFLVVSVLVAVAVGEGMTWSWGQRALLGLVLGAAFVLVEQSLGRMSFRRLSHALFGLGVGMVGASILSKYVVATLFRYPGLLAVYEADKLAIQNSIELVIFAVLGYYGVALALRSDREEFGLIIPYLRFKRDASEGEPLLLDTNIVIDGRIGKLAATGFLTGSLVVPRAVLDELQLLADSKDTLKSERGKRGLALLEDLRNRRDVDLSIHEEGSSAEDQPVDARIVSIAKALNARLLTNDENLMQVARLRGITVLSLNHLAKALQQELQVGDSVDVTLTKPGKDKGQAVGYLPDGAMVVVNQGQPLMGQKVLAKVVGVTQTSAGRLVFAEVL
jgi:uncharacterized protein YacL